MSDERVTNGNADDDDIERWIESAPIVTNDAAAGETVLPGPGEGNNGPTGGAEREFEPVLDEHDEQKENPDDIDLDDGGDDLV